MGPMCKIETEHQPCSRRSVTAFPGCAISLPMAATPATSCVLRSRARASGALRSSSDPTRPRASRFYRADGSLNAPSPGLAAADVSPRTGRKPSKAPQRGRSSPASGSSHADSQDTAIQHKLLSPALSLSLAFWLRSCGVAECVGDAVEQRGSEFLHLWRDLGREETLFPPDLTADSGERVGEGWALLAIPSSRRDRQTRLEAEPGGQERDQGEQPEQTRCRTGEGQLRPP